VTTPDGDTKFLTLGCAVNPNPRVPACAETICVGDILIFDGDVIHRGCAYKSTCVAMHIYLDVPQVKRPPPNEPGSFMKLPTKKARA
jgi:hypothetical protein